MLSAHGLVWRHNVKQDRVCNFNKPHGSYSDGCRLRNMLILCEEVIT